MNIRLLLTLLFCSFAGLARADTLTLFDGTGSALVQLDLPSTLQVVEHADGEYFTVFGTSAVYGDTYLGFGSANYALQFYLAGGFGFDYFVGPQLYGNGESMPSLVEGSYELTSLENLPYTLTIQGAAAAPEPNSIVLCATGIAFLLFGVFRTRARFAVDLEGALLSGVEASLD